MKIGLVTLCIGDFAGPPQWGILSKRDYCALRGYDFHRHVQPLDPTRPPQWNIIPAILRHLADYDWLFWSDADSLIIDNRIRLESFIDEEADLVLTRDENGPSAAQMFIRNTPAARAALEGMMQQTDLLTAPRGTSLALSRVIDGSVAGVRAKFLPRESFNSDIASLRADHFLLHCGTSPFRPMIMDTWRSRSNLSITFRPQLPWLLTNLGLTGHGAEVGVKLGEFSTHFVNHWPGKMLHLVDCWRNVGPVTPGPYFASDQQLEDQYQKVVVQFGNKPGVTIHRAMSLEAAARFEDGFFDWIYIDADHTYESVRDDLRAWYPKLRNGGIFAGHDFTDRQYPWGKFGVRTAVAEFVSPMELNLFLTAEGDEATWYFVKG